MGLDVLNPISLRLYAAKAVGLKQITTKTYVGSKTYYPALDYCTMSHQQFDPLCHNGDATCLLVQLELDVSCGQEGTVVYFPARYGLPSKVEILVGGSVANKMEAFRKAATLAAAMIGEKKEQEEFGSL